MQDNTHVTFAPVSTNATTAHELSNAGLDKSRRLIAELSPGTIVLMKNEDMGNDEAPWSPPMVVVSRHGNSYKLRWGGSGTLLDRLVPVHRLKVAPRAGPRWIWHIRSRNYHRPPTRRRWPGGVTHRVYLIKWAGFDKADATWEPGDTLQEGAMDAISDYWAARRPTAQQQPSKPSSGRQRRKDRRIEKLKAKLVPH
jgi:hypothetical protein